MSEVERRIANLKMFVAVIKSFIGAETVEVREKWGRWLQRYLSNESNPVPDGMARDQARKELAMAEADGWPCAVQPDPVPVPNTEAKAREEPEEDLEPDVEFESDGVTE